VDSSLAERMFDTLRDTPTCYFPAPGGGTRADTPSSTD